MRPAVLDDLQVAFPASVRDLLPAWDDLPDEFRRDWHYDRGWCGFVSDWFYKGADPSALIAQPGIDKTAALRHLQTVLGSFEPKHEHKIAGAAYLCSLWFEGVPKDSSGAQA